MVPKKSGRRGSLPKSTARSSYKDVMKDTIVTVADLHSCSLALAPKVEVGASY
jgi:hypothetical protein